MPIAAMGQYWLKKRNQEASSKKTPRWHANPKRLVAFLEALPAEYRYAFEFRDSSWFDSQIYDTMTTYNAAFCIYHLAGVLSPQEVTADFVYVRLHGPGGAYKGRYDDRTLSGWAGAFAAWAQQEKEVYCYFDNDEAGYAVQNALRLQEMISWKT